MKFFIFQCSLALLSVWWIRSAPSFDNSASQTTIPLPLPIDTTEANKLYHEAITQLEQNQLVNAKELLKKAETLGYQRPYELDYQLARLYAQKKQYCTSEIHLKKAIKSGVQDYEFILGDTMFTAFQAQDVHHNPHDDDPPCGQFWVTYCNAFKNNRKALFKSLVIQFPKTPIDSITLDFLYQEDLNSHKIVGYDYTFDYYDRKEQAIQYRKNKKSSPTTYSEEIFLNRKYLFFEFQHFRRFEDELDSEEAIWAEYIYPISNKSIALIYSKQNWDYAWLPRTYYLETYSLDGKKIASRKIAWRQFHDCQTIAFDHQTGKMYAIQHELIWKKGISPKTTKVLTIKDIEQIKAKQKTVYFVAEDGNIGMTIL